MLHLNLTRTDLGAITKLALMIADSDGERHQREIDYICAVLNKIGIAQEWVSSVLVDAIYLSESQAKSQVSLLNFTQKKFVCAFLGSVVFIDSKVLPSEMQKWSTISKDCGLSSMSLEDAYKTMSQFLS